MSSNISRVVAARPAQPQHDAQRGEPERIANLVLLLILTWTEFSSSLDGIAQRRRTSGMQFPKTDKPWATLRKVLPGARRQLGPL